MFISFGVTALAITGVWFGYTYSETFRDYGGFAVQYALDLKDVMTGK